MTNSSPLSLEISAALDAAKGCADILEYLLVEAKLLGDTSPTMHKRVIAANYDLQASLEKYLNAHEQYGKTQLQ